MGGLVVAALGAAKAQAIARRNWILDQMTELRWADAAQAQVDSVMGIWLGVIVSGFFTLVLAGLCAVWVVLAVKFRRE